MKTFNLKVLWNKACEYDRIPMDSKFAVFSDHNPFWAEYQKAMNIAQKCYAASRGRI